ncbi:MAG TPA: pyridoxamine 5'-phosphate oxidase [Verrucomicrobiae bacterium]|jgi:pyridoxamine 5'-phosphate oxidase
MKTSLAHLRKEYTLTGLRRADLNPDPLAQFRKWLQQAVDADVPEPSAMTLATVDAEGQPSARIVLLKGLDERGFSFFTNYESRKGRELAANPRASLLFLWKELERQVGIRGLVSKLSRKESATYFKTRPRGSRLGAWASKQSQVIASRAMLEDKLRELERKFPGEDVPLPPYWGGYILAPAEIEFWQGRPNRLHDRFLYTRASDQGWKIERLSP